MNLLLHLQIFVRVVDSGSFSRAAEHMGMAASSVTASVQKLERDLGTRLLQRTTRRVRPTADGEQLYERAMLLLADAEEAQTLFRQHSTQARGRLRVEMPSRIARLIIAPALPALMAQHPDLEIELNSSDRIADLVEAGIDCVLRVGAAGAPHLAARSLGELRLATCASPGLVAEHGMPSNPHELSRFPAIHYGPLPSGGQDEWELGSAGQRHHVPMRGRIAVNNTESYVACCIAGLGVIQAPAYDVQAEINSGKLVELLPDHPPAPLSLQVFYPGQHRQSRRLRVFIDWLAEVMAPYAQAQFQAPQKRA